MTKVVLPDLPQGKEFEEFLAAFFQSHGFFVERSIIDRQEEEVLELDFIATSYSHNEAPKQNLFEVKGGRWGFGEVFKLRGWLDYLNHDSASLLVAKNVQHINFYKKISEKLNINIIPIEDLNNTPESLNGFITPENIKKEDIGIWRFSYWMERQLMSLLTSKKKSIQDKQCYNALSRYYYLINSGTFLTRNIVERADKLYSIYKEYPNISAKLGHELIGENFHDDHQNIPKQLYASTYYSCELTDLAISTFVEHRARLSILKAAIDYKIYKNLGFDHNEGQSFKFGNIEWEHKLLDNLPLSFRNGLEQISMHQYFYLYPVFWQWFLFVFGGFILKDYLHQEYQLLSDKTGIPIEEIDNAIRSYEILFPRDGGWFVEPPNTNIKFLALFPVPYMGLGVSYRRWIYTEDHDINNLKLTGPHTKDDLRKWNNLGVGLLNKQFKS